MHYESILACPSVTTEGVVFHVRRMSFGRRLELLKRLRELAGRCELYRAGDTADDKLAAALAEAEIRTAYIEWGLAAIDGLTIDGRPATAGILVEAGPEALCREVAERIRSECFLSDEERKN